MTGTCRRCGRALTGPLTLAAGHGARCALLALAESAEPPPAASTAPTPGQAAGLVRDAVLASVALVTRDVQGVDVPVRFLTEGVDADLVSQVLAGIVATLLTATLPDGGRDLLAAVSRTIVDEGR